MLLTIFLKTIFLKKQTLVPVKGVDRDPRDSCKPLLNL